MNQTELFEVLSLEQQEDFVKQFLAMIKKVDDSGVLPGDYLDKRSTAIQLKGNIYLLVSIFLKWTHDDVITGTVSEIIPLTIDEYQRLTNADNSTVDKKN